MQDYSFVVNIIAGLLLVSAQLVYVIQVLKKQITPSILTWFGWSMLVIVALISQIVEFGWSWILLGHLFSAIGCAVIFISAFFAKNYIIYPKDWPFLFLGLACIVFYLVFSSSWLTTIFSILADAILGVPTIIKAYKLPRTEKTIGWRIALLSWTLTLLTGNNDKVIFIIFPAYCFLFNATMSYLTRSKRIESIESISFGRHNLT